MISVRQSALKFKGSGNHMRLRVPRVPDALGTVRELCRGSVALEKAMGEAIRDAVAAGHSWEEIGHALGVEGTQAAQVREQYGTSREWMRSRFWGFSNTS